MSCPVGSSLSYSHAASSPNSSSNVPSSSSTSTALNTLDIKRWKKDLGWKDKSSLSEEALGELSKAIKTDCANQAFQPNHLVNFFTNLDALVKELSPGSSTASTRTSSYPINHPAIDAAFNAVIEQIQISDLSKMQAIIDCVMENPQSKAMAIRYAEKSIRSFVQQKYNLAEDGISVQRIRGADLSKFSQGEYAFHICNLFRLADPAPNHDGKNQGDLVLQKWESVPVSDQLGFHPASVLLQSITGFVFHPDQLAENGMNSSDHPASFPRLPETIARKLIESQLYKKQSNFIDTVFIADYPCYEGVTEPILNYKANPTRIIYHQRPQWNKDWGSANIEPLLAWAVRESLKEFGQAFKFSVESRTDEEIEFILSASPHFAKFLVVNKALVLEKILDKNHKKELLDFEVEIESALTEYLENIEHDVHSALSHTIEAQGVYKRVFTNLERELNVISDLLHPLPATYIKAMHVLFGTGTTLVFAPNSPLILGGKKNLRSFLFIHPKSPNAFVTNGVFDFIAYQDFYHLNATRRIWPEKPLKLGAGFLDKMHEIDRRQSVPAGLNSHLSSKAMGQAIQQYTEGQGLGDFRTAANRFADMFPLYAPLVKTATAATPKNQRPVTTYAGRILPHNEAILLPSLADILGVGISSLSHDEIGKALKVIESLNAEYQKRGVPCAPFDAYLHTWCNNSISHVVRFQPEGLRCWTYEALVPFVANRSTHASMAWDCSQQFIALYQLMLKTNNNRQQGYALLDLSLIPSELVTEHGLSSNNLLECLFESLPGRFELELEAQFELIRPFILMLAASKVAITPKLKTLAGQNCPQAIPLLNELEGKTPQARVDAFITDRLAVLSKSYPNQFPTTNVLLQRRNGQYEQGTVFYYTNDAQACLRVGEGTFSPQEHPGLIMTKVKLPNPLANQNPYQYSLSETCKAQTHTYLYPGAAPWDSASTRRVQVPPSGVLLLTRSVQPSLQRVGYYSRTNQYAPIRLVFSYNPSLPAPKLQIFLNAFHGEYFQDPERFAPAFEFALSEGGPLLERLKQPGEVYKHVSALKANNDTDWLLPPSPEKLPAFAYWDASQQNIYRRALSVLMHGYLSDANLSAEEKESIQERVSLLRQAVQSGDSADIGTDAKRDFSDLVQAQRSAAALSLEGSAANPLGSGNPDFSALTQQLHEDFSNLQLNEQGAKTLQVPDFTFAEKWSAFESKLTTWSKHPDFNAAALVKTLGVEQAFGLLLYFYKCQACEDLRATLAADKTWVRNMPSFVKQKLREDSSSPTENRALLALARDILPHASRQLSRPRPHHITKTAWFMGLIAANAFGGLFSLVFDVLNIPDILDLPVGVDHNVEKARDELKVKQNEEEIAYQAEKTNKPYWHPDYQASKYQAWKEAQSATHKAQDDLNEAIRDSRASRGMLVAFNTTEAINTSETIRSVSPEHFKLNTFGQFCKKFKRWVGSVGLVGAARAIPSALTALRPDSTRLANSAGQLLERDLKARVASLHSHQEAQEAQEALAELQKTLESFERNKTPAYVRAATLKKWATVLIDNPDLQSKFWPDQPAQSSSTQGLGESQLLSRAELHAALIRYGKYYTAQQMGANLSSLSMAQKGHASVKGLWEGVKFVINRLMRFSVVAVHMASIKLSLTYTIPCSMEGIMMYVTQAMDQRAKHLQEKSRLIVKPWLKVQPRLQPELEMVGR